MSETEQGDGQSLEDILSSIRQKISADPDMSIVQAGVGPAVDAGAPLVAGLNGEDGLPQKDAASSDATVIGSLSPDGDPLGGVDTPKSATDVFADRLSDMLGRAEPQDPVVTAAVPLADDDLSDILDNPLPAPLEGVRAGDKPAQADGAVTSGSDLGNGLARLASVTKQSTGPNGTKSEERPKNKLGTFVPTQAGGQSRPAASTGGLAAKLKTGAELVAEQVGAPPVTKPKKDSPKAAAEERKASPEVASATLPRSMTSLSSGFVLPLTQGAQASSGKRDGADGTGAKGVSDSSAAGNPSPGSAKAKDDSKAGALKVTFPAPKAKSAPAPAPSSTPASSPAPASKVASSAPLEGATSASPAVVASEPSPVTAQQAVVPAPAVVIKKEPDDRAAEGGGHGSGKTLEDTVSELLRPMLHEWLEANMQRIVLDALRIEGGVNPGGRRVDAKG